jgi:lipopolysaccharide/colanic/teichoic acid biosynthesis glycosyltransferase
MNCTNQFLKQRKLINERKKRGIFKVKPGITGLAQISGITMETPIILAKTEFTTSVCFGV